MKMLPSLIGLSLALVAASRLHALPSAFVPASPKPYNLSQVFHVGGVGNYWDSLIVDPDHKLLFASRGTHVMVLDAITGAAVADIEGQKHSHGIALVPSVGRGFISDGQDGSVVVFDLKTYKVLGKIKTEVDADAINYDPVSNRVWVVSGDGGDITAISPDIDLTSGKAEAPVSLDGKPEHFALDQGKAYINLADKNEVAVLDTRANKVIARWPTAPGGVPVSMGLDSKKHRLFVGCRNPQKLIVMSSDDGKIISEVPIGAGVDGTQFDGDVFCSGRDGSLTVARETSPGRFERIETLATKPWAGTMGVDPMTHTVYLPTAEFAEPPAGVTDRPASVPGSFVLVLVNLASAHPPWGKAKDNKIYAQQLAFQTVAANPDLGDVGLHAIPPGGKDYVIVAQTMDKIGKQSSPGDLDVIERDATKIYPFMIGDSPRFSSLIPLRDSSGKIIGMVVFSFKRVPGVDKLSVDERTVKLAAEIAKKIPNAEALFKPTL